MTKLPLKAPLRYTSIQQEDPLTDPDADIKNWLYSNSTLFNNEYGGWFAAKQATKEDDLAQHMTINLGTKQTVNGLIMSGVKYSPPYNKKATYVRRVHVSYSVDNVNYLPVDGHDDVYFEAIKNYDDREDNNYVGFYNGVDAQYIRVHPLKWWGHIAMRVGLTISRHGNTACGRAPTILGLPSTTPTPTTGQAQTTAALTTGAATSNGGGQTNNLPSTSTPSPMLSQRILKTYLTFHLELLAQAPEQSETAPSLMLGDLDPAVLRSLLAPIIVSGFDDVTTNISYTSSLSDMSFREQNGIVELVLDVQSSSDANQARDAILKMNMGDLVQNLNGLLVAKSLSSFDAGTDMNNSSSGNMTAYDFYPYTDVRIASSGMLVNGVLFADEPIKPFQVFVSLGALWDDKALFIDSVTGQRWSAEQLKNNVIDFAAPLIASFKNAMGLSEDQEVVVIGDLIWNEETGKLDVTFSLLDVDPHEQARIEKSFRDFMENDSSKLTNALGVAFDGDNSSSPKTFTTADVHGMLLPGETLGPVKVYYTFDVTTLLSNNTSEEASSALLNLGDVALLQDELKTILKQNTQLKDWLVDMFRNETTGSSSLARHDISLAHFSLDNTQTSIPFRLQVAFDVNDVTYHDQDVLKQKISYAQESVSLRKYVLHDAVFTTLISTTNAVYDIEISSGALISTFTAILPDKQEPGPILAYTKFSMSGAADSVNIEDTAFRESLLAGFRTATGLTGQHGVTIHEIFVGHDGDLRVAFAIDGSPYDWATIKKQVLDISGTISGALPETSSDSLLNAVGENAIQQILTNPFSSAALTAVLLPGETVEPLMAYVSLTDFAMEPPINAAADLLGVNMTWFRNALVEGFKNATGLFDKDVAKIHIADLGIGKNGELQVTYQIQPSPYDVDLVKASILKLQQAVDGSVGLLTNAISDAFIENSAGNAGVPSFSAAVFDFMLPFSEHDDPLDVHAAFNLTITPHQSAAELMNDAEFMNALIAGFKNATGLDANQDVVVTELKYNEQGVLEVSFALHVKPFDCKSVKQKIAELERHDSDQLVAAMNDAFSGINKDKNSSDIDGLHVKFHDADILLPGEAPNPLVAHAVFALIIEPPVSGDEFRLNLTFSEPLIMGFKNATGLHPDYEIYIGSAVFYPDTNTFHLTYVIHGLSPAARIAAKRQILDVRNPKILANGVYDRFQDESDITCCYNITMFGAVVSHTSVGMIITTETTTTTFEAPELFQVDGEILRSRVQDNEESFSGRFANLFVTMKDLYSGSFISGSGSGGGASSAGSTHEERQRLFQHTKQNEAVMDSLDNGLERFVQNSPTEFYFTLALPVAVEFLGDLIVEDGTVHNNAISASVSVLGDQLNAISNVKVEVHEDEKSRQKPVYVYDNDRGYVYAIRNPADFSTKNVNVTGGIDMEQMIAMTIPSHEQQDESASALTSSTSNDGRMKDSSGFSQQVEFELFAHSVAASMSNGLYNSRFDDVTSDSSTIDDQDQPLNVYELVEMRQSAVLLANATTQNEESEDEIGVHTEVTCMNLVRFPEKRTSHASHSTAYYLVLGQNVTAKNVEVARQVKAALQLVFLGRGERTVRRRTTDSEVPDNSSPQVSASSSSQSRQIQPPINIDKNPSVGPSALLDGGSSTLSPLDTSSLETGTFQDERRARAYEQRLVWLAHKVGEIFNDVIFRVPLIVNTAGLGQNSKNHKHISSSVYALLFPEDQTESQNEDEELNPSTVQPSSAETKSWSTSLKVNIAAENFLADEPAIFGASTIELRQPYVDSVADNINSGPKKIQYLDDTDVGVVLLKIFNPIQFAFCMAGIAILCCGGAFAWLCMAVISGNMQLEDEDTFLGRLLNESIELGDNFSLDSDEMNNNRRRKGDSSSSDDSGDSSTTRSEKMFRKKKKKSPLRNVVQHTSRLLKKYLRPGPKRKKTQEQRAKKMCAVNHFSDVVIDPMFNDVNMILKEHEDGAKEILHQEYRCPHDGALLVKRVYFPGVPLSSKKLEKERGEDEGNEGAANSKHMKDSRNAKNRKEEQEDFYSTQTEKRKWLRATLPSFGLDMLRHKKSPHNAEIREEQQGKVKNIALKDEEPHPVVALELSKDQATSNDTNGNIKLCNDCNCMLPGVDSSGSPSSYIYVCTKNSAVHVFCEKYTQEKYVANSTNVDASTRARPTHIAFENEVDELLQKTGQGTHVSFENEVDELLQKAGQDVTTKSTITARSAGAVSAGVSEKSFALLSLPSQALANSRRMQNSNRLQKSTDRNKYNFGGNDFTMTKTLGGLPGGTSTAKLLSPSDIINNAFKSMSTKSSQSTTTNSQATNHDVVSSTTGENKQPEGANANNRHPKVIIDSIMVAEQHGVRKVESNKDFNVKKAQSAPAEEPFSMRKTLSGRTTKIRKVKSDRDGGFKIKKKKSNRTTNKLHVPEKNRENGLVFAIDSRDIHTHKIEADLHNALIQSGAESRKVAAMGLQTAAIQSTAFGALFNESAVTRKSSKQEPFAVMKKSSKEPFAVMKKSSKESINKSRPGAPPSSNATFQNSEFSPGVPAMTLPSTMTVRKKTSSTKRPMLVKRVVSSGRGKKASKANRETVGKVDSNGTSAVGKVDSNKSNSSTKKSKVTRTEHNQDAFGKTITGSTRDESVTQESRHIQFSASSGL